jgi:hypothetical protein
MLFWLVDHYLNFFFFLVFIAAALLLAWWRFRRRSLAIAAGVTGALMLGLILLEFFIISDQKAMRRALEDMCRQVSDKQPDRLFAHLAEDCFYEPLRLNKAALLARARPHIARGAVTECYIWELDVETISRPERTAAVLFYVKVRGRDGMEAAWRCRTIFTLESDGKWRVKSFQLYPLGKDPVPGNEVRIPI